MPLRSRLTAVLFGGAALGTTGYIAAVTVSTLAVEEITGRATLSGLPGALAVAGTAVGTTLLTLRVGERGRRPGLVLGYLLGALGAATAVAGVVASSFLLILVGMAVTGLGRASNQLARYAAAELYPPERRASALSLIVWAGTVGSVVGPSLLQPFGSITSAWGTSELGGGYLVTALFMAAAMALYVIALRPDPMTIAHDDHDPEPYASGFGDSFQQPHVKVALAGLIAGQVVMVLIMTTTPLHIRHGGSDLGTVGLVMSAHTLGMFAFSPLTGRLADRIGRYQTVVVSLVVLSVAAILAATVPVDSTPALLAALFLLGVGWNLGFVASSALLTVGFAPGLRARLQGRADSITWISSAVASLSSGLLFQVFDYRILSLVGLVLLIVPALVLARHRAGAITVATG